jgi:hypothetical protein
MVRVLAVVVHWCGGCGQCGVRRVTVSHELDQVAECEASSTSSDDSTLFCLFVHKSRDSQRYRTSIRAAVSLGIRWVPRNILGVSREHLHRRCWWHETKV